MNRRDFTKLMAATVAGLAVAGHALPAIAEEKGKDGKDKCKGKDGCKGKDKASCKGKDKASCKGKDKGKDKSKSPTPSPTPKKHS